MIQARLLTSFPTTSPERPGEKRTIPSDPRVGILSSNALPPPTPSPRSSYLKFIVDYYDILPEALLMLHSHRYAYHQEDILLLLSKLNLKSASWAGAYCNINHAVWGYKEDPDRDWMRINWEDWLGEWLGDDYPPTRGDGRSFPHPVLERCCAQFVVGRDRVRKRPREFYEKALEVMYSAKDEEESRKMGLLMEWVWHMIFGEPQVVETTGEKEEREADEDQRANFEGRGDERRR
jgi:hypothetical protein